MEYRKLGRSGLKVSPLCLGAMMFGDRTDEKESAAIIANARDAGVNFLDTADAYSAGRSEEICGRAIAAERARWVLATKLANPGGPEPNDRGTSRRWMLRACEASLKRLGTDWIDLYQMHRPDKDTDVEETLSALTDLQRQGKIRAFGSSTFPAHEIVEAQWTAQRRGLGRFVTEQPPYSMLVRAIEADLLPVAERYGMGVIPWSPLAGGWLTGRYRKGQDLPRSRRSDLMPQRYDMSQPENQRKLDAVEELTLLAEQSGISLIHLALAFVIRHPAVTAAIIGPRTSEQLESQLGAVAVELSDEVLDRIDEIVPPGTNFSQADAGWINPELEPTARRERPPARAARAF